MKKPDKLLVVALLIFVVLTQFTIFFVNRLPWFDVAFSLETVHKMRTDGLGSVDFRHFDVHPATYYYALYGWSYLNPGISEYHWSQEMSLLFMMIFLVFIYYGLKELFGAPGMMAAATFVLLSTYIHYGTEVRMYGLVLMLSGICFYAVVRRFEGKWLWIGSAAALLMPLTHYLAGLAFPFFAVLYILREKMTRGWTWKDVGDVGIFTMAGGVGLVLTAVIFLIPQKARIAGMWLPVNDVSSWPSSLLFSFFNTTDRMQPGLFTSAIYVGFLVLLAVFAVLAWRALASIREGDTTENVQRALLVLMGLTGLYTLFALIAQHWVTLYHHRFFLAETWMFAAMALVVLWRLVYLWVDENLSTKGLIRARFIGTSALLILLIVMVCIVGMLAKYWAETPRELENIMKHTPCTQQEKTILHESPFTSLTFEVYARENHCNWTNVVSTDLTREMANSAGFDIIPDRNIYWNHTVPVGSYYYVQVDYNLTGGEDIAPADVYDGDGVRLVYVRRKVA